MKLNRLSYRNKYLFVFLILLTQDLLVSSQDSNSELLTDPYVFKDEICSYNGVVDLIASTKIEIFCKCNPEYANDPKETLKINKSDVQCSYQRKRKFIALFLAVFIPAGFDHFYLGNWLAFGVIFIFISVTVMGNMYRFAISSEDDYLKNKINLIFFICIFVFLFFWIANVFFILFYSKDSLGIELYEDIDLLFSF